MNPDFVVNLAHPGPFFVRMPTGIVLPLGRLEKVEVRADEKGRTLLTLQCSPVEEQRVQAPPCGFKEDATPRSASAVPESPEACSGGEDYVSYEDWVQRRQDEKPGMPRGQRFHVGDVVQLASGGEQMTIEQASAEEVICTWFDEAGELASESFNPRMLRRG